MSRDLEDLGVRPAEAARLRTIFGGLGEEDAARVDPPVELWRRIAAAVAASEAPIADTGPAAAVTVVDADVERLRAIAARVGDEDFARVDPPVEVWRRIAAAVAETDAAPADPPSVATAPLDTPSPTAPVVSLDAHRRRHRRVLTVVAAAAVVVVAVTGAVLFRNGSSTDGDETQLVASTELEPLEPVGGATAEVRLVRQEDHFQLELEARDMAAAPEGQHYELWLLDPESESAEPVSLGAMTGSTSVPVPAGVDPDEYAVVDVSLQEQGQIEHSGHSLLRGTLA